MSIASTLGLTNEQFLNMIDITTKTRRMEQADLQLQETVGEITK